MHIRTADTVLHLSFEDEPFERANVLCGQFNKRQIGIKSFKQIERNSALLPFKDKQFDVVYSSHVLQIVDDPVFIFNEIRRISRAAYIKEYSEFAEILFGWPSHQWVLDIENDKLVVRRKNPQRYHKFGPLFHTLYQDDQNVHEAFKKHDSILKIAFDWYESDDIVVKSEKPLLIDYDIEIEENEDEPEVIEDDAVIVVEETKKDITTPVLKSSQSDHFDYERHELGFIQQLIDIP